MRFGLAITAILSGASASVDDVDVHIDKTLTGNHGKINAVRAPVSLSSSSNSEKEQHFVLSPSEDSNIEDTPTSNRIAPIIGSRKLHNSILDKEDYDIKGKAVTLDESSTFNTNTVEFCSKNVLGVLMPCSSKEDASIDESNLLGHNDDTSAATVVDDEGVHHFYLAPEHYYLDTVDGESLDTKEEVKDHRQLRSDNDCEAYCSSFERPVISVYYGSEFQSLINDCTGADTSDCPYYNTPLDCWITSQVTDMKYAFFTQFDFDDPLGCWDTANVNKMNYMFASTNAFNQPIKSWDVSNVEDMRGMFARTVAFNQHIESWDVSKVSNMNSMFKNAGAFNQSTELWNVSKVEDMIGMFWYAPQFNQCLSTWADKTTGTVETKYMLNASGCPSQSDPDPNVGPWCQGIGEGCYAPTTSPTYYPTRSKKAKKTKKNKGNKQSKESK